MEEDDPKMEPIEEEDPKEGFSEGGEQIIGEEDPDEDPKEDPEEDAAEDPMEDGVKLTYEVYFEEEPEDPRAQSGVLEAKGEEHKDRVTAWKRERYGRMCRGECPLEASNSGG